MDDGAVHYCGIIPLFRASLFRTLSFPPPDQIKQTDGVERLSITLIGAKIKGLGEGMGDKDGKNSFEALNLADSLESISDHKSTPLRRKMPGQPGLTGEAWRLNCLPTTSLLKLKPEC